MRKRNMFGVAKNGQGKRSGVHETVSPFNPRKRLCRHAHPQLPHSAGLACVH